MIDVRPCSLYAVAMALSEPTLSGQAAGKPGTVQVSAPPQVNADAVTPSESTVPFRIFLCEKA
jgi:hypothetical protein